MAEYTVFYIVLFAEIHEALDSSVGGDVLRGRCIDMDQYVTVMSGQEAGGLYGAHVIIGVDAGEMCIRDRPYKQRVTGSSPVGPIQYVKSE